MFRIYLVITVILAAVFISGCPEDQILVTPVYSGQYAGLYCEYRDMGQTFIKDCIPIDMSFTDQKAHYRLFMGELCDSVICEATVDIVLEDSAYFDSASTVFSDITIYEIYLSGNYSVRITDDSLCFYQFDEYSEVGHYINMEAIQ